MKTKSLAVLSILIISLCATVSAQPIFKNGFEKIIIPVVKLNDTGITWSGEYSSGNLTECSNPASNPSPQDCNTGRDLTHNDDSDGHAGFSFTKLDASGTPLADQSVDYATIQWSCVQDNVTGLVWEVKATTAGIHNKDNTYQWGGLTAIGRDHPEKQGVYYDPSWNELVQGSNDDTLCGFSNWRVPTVAELSSIVNKGTFNPAIDTNYFPNTASSWFWSSSPFAFIPDYAWIVFFSYGYDGNDSGDSSYRVRLVRSGQ